MRGPRIRQPRRDAQSVPVATEVEEPPEVFRVEPEEAAPEERDVSQHLYDLWAVLALGD